MRELTPIFLSSLLICSCNQYVVDAAPTLDPDDVVDTLAYLGANTLHIQREFRGGATGDTIYKLWDCQAEYRECVLIGMMDSHDNEIPELRLTKNQPFLLINSDDSLWQFQSIIHSSQNDSVSLLIHYRDAEY